MVDIKNTVGKLVKDKALLIGAATFLGGLATVANLRNSSTLDAFGASLYFPEDLGSTKHPYYISFSFREYQRRSIFDRKFLKDVGMIRLPPPNQLVDASSVSYDQKGNSLIVGAAIENALAGRSSLADTAKRLTGSNIAEGTAGVAGAIGSGGLGAVAGLGVGLVSGTNTAASNTLDQVLQIGGVAQNPFLTILFNSPTFKKHQFTWVLNPSNENETEIANAIVNKFKYHQLPDISNYAGGTLLSYPDIALVGLYPNDHYLYKFKPCVIESVVVDYSHDGQPAYFASTDAPVSIKLQISLLEIEYWIKPDILVAQDESKAADISAKNSVNFLR